jgi:hypothetical protein
MQHRPGRGLAGTNAVQGSIRDRGADPTGPGASGHFHDQILTADAHTHCDFAQIRDRESLFEKQLWWYRSHITGVGKRYIKLKGSNPHAASKLSPDSRTRRPSPLRNMSGAHVMGSIARPRRRRLGSPKVSPE